jgi:hypothetical protein
LRPSAKFLTRMVANVDSANARDISANANAAGAASVALAAAAAARPALRAAAALPTPAAARARVMAVVNLQRRAQCTALLREVALSFGFELQLLEDDDADGAAEPAAALPASQTGARSGVSPNAAAPRAAARPRPALEDLRAALRAAPAAPAAPVARPPLLKRKLATVVLAPAAARGLAAAGITARVDVAKRIRLRR